MNTGHRHDMECKIYFQRFLFDLLAQVVGGVHHRLYDIQAVKFLFHVEFAGDSFRNNMQQLTKFSMT